MGGASCGDPAGAGARGFSFGGKTLLSGVDPEGRADRAASAVGISDRTLCLCPSPLFGHGLARLLERVEQAPGAAVLCVEAEPELLELSRRSLGRAGLLAHPRLRLSGCSGGAAGLCALVRREWGPRAFKHVRAARLSGGWQLHADLYGALERALQGEAALDWGNAMTLARLGRRYMRNAARNLALAASRPSLGELSFGADPVLALGAGPSLDGTLGALFRRFGEALREPGSRPFRVACADTCLPALKARGIRPDIAVALESQHWNLGDFVGLSGWEVPLAMDLSALPRSGSVLAGGLFLFFTPWAPLRVFGRLAGAGLLPAALPPLGSVGLTAAAAALRLTSGPVICAGIDFSFTLDMFHARSSPGHGARLRGQSRLSGILNAHAAFGPGAFSAASKSGEGVFSTPALRGYRDLFEREFGAPGGAFLEEGAPFKGGAPFSGGGAGGRLFDVAGSGLPLGIRALACEEAFALLAAPAPAGLPGALPAGSGPGGAGLPGALPAGFGPGGAGLSGALPAGSRPCGAGLPGALPAGSGAGGAGLSGALPAGSGAADAGRAGGGGVGAAKAAALRAFARAEHGRLELLRGMLTGSADPGGGGAGLDGLVGECDYLWAHFPDYAASALRPPSAGPDAAAQLGAASPNALSFFKRLRAEIDPFLRLFEGLAGLRE